MSEALRAKIALKFGIFKGGVGQFQPKFQVEVYVYYQPFLYI